MASLDYHPVAHGMLPFSKTEPAQVCYLKIDQKWLSNLLPGQE
jgi:hypothetical protein